MYGMEKIVLSRFLENIKEHDLKFGIRLKSLFYYLEGVYYLNDYEIRNLLQKIDLELLGIMFKFFPKNHTDKLIAKFSSNIKIDLLYGAKRSLKLSDAIIELTYIEKVLKNLERNNFINMLDSSRNKTYV